MRKQDKIAYGEAMMCLRNLCGDFSTPNTLRLEVSETNLLKAVEMGRDLKSSNPKKPLIAQVFYVRTT